MLDSGTKLFTDPFDIITANPAMVFMFVTLSVEHCGNWSCAVHNLAISYLLYQRTLSIYTKFVSSTATPVSLLQLRAALLILSPQLFKYSGFIFYPPKWDFGSHLVHPISHPNRTSLMYDLNLNVEISVEISSRAHIFHTAKSRNKDFITSLKFKK